MTQKNGPLSGDYARLVQGGLNNLYQPSKVWRALAPYEKLKIFEKLHVKHTDNRCSSFEKSIQKWKFSKFLAIFTSNNCYFSDKQSILDKLLQFSKKSEPRNFDRNHWIPPTIHYKLRNEFSRELQLIFKLGGFFGKVGENGASGVLVILTVSVEELATFFVFECPCNRNNFQYGLSYLLGKWLSIVFYCWF